MLRLNKIKIYLIKRILIIFNNIKLNYLMKFFPKKNNLNSN